jgi:hypothetical protein
MFAGFLWISVESNTKRIISDSSTLTINSKLQTQNFKLFFGAEGGTRTPTGFPTTPSRWRVCQFHHFGTCADLLKHPLRPTL